MKQVRYYLNKQKNCNKCNLKFKIFLSIQFLYQFFNINKYIKN